jgi:hypothetical protein
VVLVSWLVMMFVSFGLFTPPNPTAFGALFFGAFAVATSIFLIEEMSRPLGGFITIPSEPMRNAFPFWGSRSGDLRPCVASPGRTAANWASSQFRYWPIMR